MALTADDVRAILRKELEEHDLSISAWAAQHDIFRAHVYAFLDAERQPSIDILQALGLCRRIVYEPLNQSPAKRRAVG